MKHLAGSLSLNSHLSNGVPTDPCDWCVLLGILRYLSLIERTAKTGDFVVDILKKMSISRHIRSPACMSSKKIFPPLESLEIFAILKTVTQNQYMCVCLQQTHICRHIFHFLATVQHNCKVVHFVLPHILQCATTQCSSPLHCV